MKQLILNLPDELSVALSSSGQDLSRAALEALALEAYRERKLTTAQLRRILGFETRYELDGLQQPIAGIRRRKAAHHEVGATR